MISTQKTRANLFYCKWNGLVLCFIFGLSAVWNFPTTISSDWIQIHSIEEKKPQHYYYIILYWLVFNQFFNLISDIRFIYFFPVLYCILYEMSSIKIVACIVTHRIGLCSELNKKKSVQSDQANRGERERKSARAKDEGKKEWRELKNNSYTSSFKQFELL